MPRITPLPKDNIPGQVDAAFEKHVRQYNSRITNMKSTLARSLPAFEVYMQWYVLYKEVEKILGERLAPLFAYSVSHATDCPLCSTYFRKTIIDAGENPERLMLNEKEEEVLRFGSVIVKNYGHIADHFFNFMKKYFTEEELVVLIAFAGQMIATNIFNNVVETDIDEYLLDYFRPLKYA